MHISKAQIKLVRSLQHKKYRDELGLFVAEGDKCINELAKAFELVLHVDETNATATEIAQMSSLRTPQGSIAVFRQPNEDKSYIVNRPIVNGLTLVLDGIQDPGNLGTIIRTADWFGVHDIYCSLDTADCYNPKVVQATMGSLARVHMHYVDLVQFLLPFEGRGRDGSSPIVLGTLLDGDNLYTSLNKPSGTTSGSAAQPAEDSTICVVMGNEGNGISPKVRPFITHPVRIPSYPEGADTAESLNVAIATAIVLAELRRTAQAPTGH